MMPSCSMDSMCWRHAAISVCAMRFTATITGLAVPVRMMWVTVVQQPRSAEEVAKTSLFRSRNWEREVDWPSDKCACS